MPMPTPEEVRKALSSFGRQIDNFNQNDAGRKFNTDERLTEGYCEGVTLDWIRRVLQGGRPAFSPRAIAGSNPEHNFQLKKQSQASRQAAAFLNWKTIKEQWQARQQEVKDTYLQNWNQAKSASIDRLEELELQILGLINGLKASQTTIQLTPKIIAGIKECLGVTLPATQQVDKVEQLYYAIPNKRAKINSTKPDATEILGNVHKDLRQNAWRDFSMELDGVHSKKRSFRNIALLYSKPTQPSLDLRGVLGSLAEVGNKDLKSSTAVKMNLGGTQNGKLFFHSTAAYLEPSAEYPYLFLDPNYGIFAFSEWGKNGVLRAIAYLYRDVYSWVQGPPDRQVPIVSYVLQIEAFGKSG